MLNKQKTSQWGKARETFKQEAKWMINYTNTYEKDRPRYKLNNKKTIEHVKYEEEITS